MISTNAFDFMLSKDSSSRVQRAEMRTDDVLIAALFHETPFTDFIAVSFLL